MIRLGNQPGDDRTNRQMDATTRRINRIKQNTADNLTNRQIMRSMVRQDFAQLWSLGESLFVGTDDG